MYIGKRGDRFPPAEGKRLPSSRVFDAVEKAVRKR